MRKIWPVVLAGGSGSRLWPISRQNLSKQFLPLVGERTMLQDTVQRVRGDGFAEPTIICNEEHRFVVAEQMRQTGSHPAHIMVEKEGRSTAPAIAVAALTLARQHGNPYLLVLPADHTVRDVAGLRAGIATAVQAAEQGRLVTFGIQPSHPATGYGYIRAGAPLAGIDGACAIERFVEKPPREVAEDLLSRGGCFWNSGMFLFTAEAYLRELERFEPDMLAACRQAVEGGGERSGFMTVDDAAFAQAASRSIDHAVMEKSANSAVVPVDIGWSDVGSWDSLWEISDKDGDGNVISGDVVALDTQDCVLYGTGRLTTTLGVRDLIVVATEDAVMVLPRDRSEDVRAIVDRLREMGRLEHANHQTVARPWGNYESLVSGQRYQVKQIVVNPGARLSLQLHHHRAEHWVVVSGTALVTSGEKQFFLHENQSTYIPECTPHRLENAGRIPLKLIEVQSGSYLGEDDIVRYDDHYGRLSAPAEE